MWLVKYWPALPLAICCLIGTHSPSAASYAADSGSGSVLVLTRLVQRAMEANFEIQAAEAAVNAQRARLTASKQPLNNPELEIGVERRDVNNFTLGMRQTIDWHDKQHSFSILAQEELASVQSRLEALRLEKIREILQAAGSCDLQRTITLLSKQRLESLEHFAELIQRRRTAGDLPQTELALARLALARARMQHANHVAELIQTQADFLQLAGENFTDQLRLPDRLPETLPQSMDLENLARQHPKVRVDHLKSRVQQQRIAAIRQAHRADPTLGISTGREDDDGLIALSLTIPLQLRNDFTSEVDAAHADSIQAEKLAQHSFKNALVRLRSARQRYNLLARAWADWLAEGYTSLRQHLNLLEIQWRAGEMDTTDYLIQLEQSIDTQIAGAQLYAKRWSAWVEWLNASHGLDDWLVETKEQ